MHKLVIEMIKSVMLKNYNVIPTYTFALNILFQIVQSIIYSEKERK